MEAGFGVERFNRYLLSARNNTKSDLIQHVVMGNESADLDSIVSAAMYAYFLSRRDPGGHVNIVPLINIGASLLSLRPEVAFHFARTGVDIASIPFVDSLCLEQLHSAGRLKLTLIDHNELAVRQSNLESGVVEIIDHHADEHRFEDIGHRVIEPVGSCATLVAEQILDGCPELLDKNLARFLLGPVLLDTVNLDPSKGRCREKDSIVGGELLRLGEICRTQFLEQLTEKRTDISSLTPDELMAKDLKIYAANGLRFGISVIPVNVEQWLDGSPGRLVGIREFAAATQLDFYLIMAYHVDGVFAREVIGFSADRGLLSRTFSSLLTPLLGLEPLTEMGFDREARDSFFISKQNHTNISRKVLVPKLKQYFLDLKDFPTKEKGSHDESCGRKTGQ